MKCSFDGRYLTIKNEDFPNSVLEWIKNNFIEVMKNFLEVDEITIDDFMSNFNDYKNEFESCLETYSLLYFIFE